jgi:hypothetical protein
MKRDETDLIRRCLETLEGLPFVEGVTLLVRPGGSGQRADGRLRVVTPYATRDFHIEANHTHLTRTMVDGVLARMAGPGNRRWILFAPHVGRPLAAYLDQQGANFADPAGNCRLQIGRRHIARIEGRPPRRGPAQGRGMGRAGMQLVFALLVRPDLLRAPVRTLAEAAGVAHATAADRIARLREDGLIHGAAAGAALAEPHRLFDLWLSGYQTLLRPKLLIGRYRMKETDPEAVEGRIETALDDEVEWAFGGGAAANRLTGYYRGQETIVHVAPAEFDVAKRLRALPARDGPLILLRPPGPLAFAGALPRTVAPQLVYAELLCAGDKRAREAAVELRRRYPDQLP